MKDAGQFNGLVVTVNPDLYSTEIDWDVEKTSEVTGKNAIYNQTSN